MEVCNTALLQEVHPRVGYSEIWGDIVRCGDWGDIVRYGVI